MNYDYMSELPPLDDDWFNAPPPDDNFLLTDDPFADDWLTDLIADQTNYDPELAEDPFVMNDAIALPAVDYEQYPVSAEIKSSSETQVANWNWHDARLIGVTRVQDEGRQYEVGCLDLYANLDTGDLGGSYLPVASFPDETVAAAFYHDLQKQVQDGGLPVQEVTTFAEAMAVRLNPDMSGWRSAEPPEYEAYEYLRELDSGDISQRDEPSPQTMDPLLQTALDLGGVLSPQPVLADQAAAQALQDIGIQADAFSPTNDPPPFYDAATGTSYWIGVFQPDKADRENCVTSILSLGTNDETGAVEAQLAPCVPGDWDKAYASAEYLIQVAQKGDIDRCFETAEGMALATDQRELWDAERGVPLDTDTTRELADYSQQWEVER